MLLGFKRQFAPYVLDGSKTHTIRGERKIAPRVGEMCHCYVDPRQKTMKLLGRWPCVKVEPITLDFTKSGIAYALRIRIGEEYLSLDEASSLAWRDGFRGAALGSIPRTAALDEMARFWIGGKRLQDAIDSPAWTGTLIHWQYGR